MQTKVRQEHFPALRTADVFAVVEVVVVVVFNLKKCSQLLYFLLFISVLIYVLGNTCISSNLFFDSCSTDTINSLKS